AKPISELTEKIEDYDLSNEENKPLKINTTTSELQDLTEKFNELIQRANDAFLFQKHSIQHISNELKTPIAVLISKLEKHQKDNIQHISHELNTPIAVVVAELEKLQKEDNINQLKSDISQQTQKAKSLGNIINVLLQISKIEAGQEISKNLIRIDDVIFDCISEVNSIYPDFNFEVNFTPNNFNENTLTIQANEPLIKQAFLNLMMNSVHYSDNQKAKITFDCDSDNLKISISNSGKTLSEEEQKFLFSHFFRGANAQTQQGFGLGLVLAQRILSMHGATIEYFTN